MTARVLRESGTAKQKAELLPRLATGEFLMSFGMSEPGGGTDVLALKTRASLQGGEWVVRGQKLYTSLRRRRRRDPSPVPHRPGAGREARARPVARSSRRATSPACRCAASS